MNVADKSLSLRQEQQRWRGPEGAGTAVEGCIQKDPGWGVLSRTVPRRTCLREAKQPSSTFPAWKGPWEHWFPHVPWFFCSLCAQSLPGQNGLLSPWILPAVWTTLTWLVFLCLSLTYYSPLETKKNVFIISGLSIYLTNQQTNIFHLQSITTGKQRLQMSSP